MNLLMIKHNIIGEFENCWHMSCVDPYKLICLLYSNFKNNIIFHENGEMTLAKKNWEKVLKENEFCLFNSSEKINQIVERHNDLLFHTEKYIKSFEILKNNYFLYIHDKGLFSCLRIDWAPELFFTKLFSQIFNLHNLNLMVTTPLYEMCSNILVIDKDSIKMTQQCLTFSYYTDNINLEFSKYLYRQYKEKEFQQYILKLN